MTVGDKGVVINIDAGGYNMTGATAWLIAAPGRFNDVGVGVTLGPVTISADGFFGTYKTSGTDFLTGGPWQLWLQVRTASGQVFTSPPGDIYVFPLPRLAA